MQTLKLNEYKPEEIKEMSMIEITFELMNEKKEPFAFNDLMKRVAEIKGMSEEEVMERISYLYTDLNVDGRFISLGDNRWGLRTWYPYEQMDEEVTQTVRRKKAKKAADDEVELDEDFDDLEEELDDEYEDLEDELDELVSDEDDDDEEDIDLDLDDDDDSEDDDIDEDLEEEDDDLL